MGVLAMEMPTTLDEGRSEAIWQSAWEAEREALLSFLRRRVRDAELAEDLLQETFVRAIRAGRVESAGELRPYLFTIAQNLAADHWRRHFRLLGKEAAREPEAGLESVADEAAESPEAEAGRRRLEQRVGEALARLPERYQQAFRLAAIEQLSYREVAERLDWSLDQVRINVHRARKRLIGELGDALVAEIRA